MSSGQMTILPVKGIIMDAEGEQQAQRFSYNVTELATVSPLPQHIRRKWDEEQQSSRDNTVSLADIEERLERAERKRKERQRRRAVKPRIRLQAQPGTGDDDHKRRKAEMLQKRLEAAEANRQSTLEAVRLKAAAQSAKTGQVAERLTEKQEALAQKLEQDQKAAEERRMARLTLEKERLSSAHEQVMQRLTEIEKRKQDAVEQLSARTELRLEQADKLREAQISSRKEKGGEQVKKAKLILEQQRLAEAQHQDAKKSSLFERLHEAQKRRKEHMASKVRSKGQWKESKERLRRSYLVRRAQKHWRTFKQKKKTTKQLVEAFVGTGITQLRLPGDDEGPFSAQQLRQSREEYGTMGTHILRDAVEISTFQDFAAKLSAKSTIDACIVLMKRFENKLLAKGQGQESVQNILKKLYPRAAQRKQRLGRYPSRVFLCAYMIIHHPEVVLDTQGIREQALDSAAHDMVKAFEQLLEKVIIPSPLPQPAQPEMGTSPNISQLVDFELQQGSDYVSVSTLLEVFDEKWEHYLDQFAAWKLHDAQSLEADLIRVSVEMERSMWAKCGYNFNSQRVQNSTDLQAVIHQVAHDHHLLSERIHRLSGPEGVERHKAALEEVRAELRDIASEVLAEAENDRERVQRQATEGLTTPRPQPPLASGTAAQAAGSGQQGAGQGAQGQDRGNEAIVWELLQDPSWRLPTEEAERSWELAVAGDDQELPQINMEDLQGLQANEIATRLQTQIRTVAEKAMWDSIKESLTVGLVPGQTIHPGHAKVAGLLAELGQEIKATIPEQLHAVAAPLVDSLTYENIVGILDSSQHGLGGEQLLGLFSHAAQLLREMGAPAREEAALQQQRRLGAKAAEVAQMEAGEARKEAAASMVTRAIRLLWAQLRLLKVDLANAKLQFLLKSIQGDGAVEYLQGKFFSHYQLTADMAAEEMGRRIPLTSMWLQETAANLQDVQRHLQVFQAVAQQGGQEGASSSAAQAVPTNLRSGLRAAPSATAQGPSQPPPSLPPLQGPVEVTSYQGLVRIAICNLVSGDTPAADPGLRPETLEYLVPKLHGAQNSYQQLIVLSACLLVLQRSRQKKSLETPQEMVEEAKTRLAAILADPNLGLPDITTEVARHIITDEEQRASVEPQVQAALQHMLSRASGAFKALCSSLTKALYVYLIQGATPMHPDVRKHLISLLQRSGAHILESEVSQLADSLRKLAAATEVVHKPVYQLLGGGGVPQQ